jgi:hypothetical protein
MHDPQRASAFIAKPKELILTHSIEHPQFLKVCILSGNGEFLVTNSDKWGADDYNHVCR